MAEDTTEVAGRRGRLLVQISKRVLLDEARNCILPEIQVLVQGLCNRRTGTTAQ